MVNLCEWKAASCQHLIKVADGIEDRDHKTHGSDKADNHLRCNSLGNIKSRSRDFFRNMGDTIWNAHGVCPIQHTKKKDEAVRVPYVRGPVTPHESIACVARTHARTWHNRTDNDGDENASYDEEQPSIVDTGQSAIGEEHDATTRPGDDQVGHKDMPLLRNKVFVMSCVHLDRQVANDG